MEPGPIGEPLERTLEVEPLRTLHELYRVTATRARAMAIPNALARRKREIRLLATAAPNIKSGKLKALAVTTAKRSPALPEVPPVADTLKGFEIDTWWGLVAPAGTPKDVIARYNQAFVAALNSPETRTRYAALMAEPAPDTPEAFGAFMKRELAKYERVVKASGAKVD